MSLLDLVDKVPPRLQVKSSGRDNLDGLYVRMKDTNHGKPCYMKGRKKDPMYLYWCHSKWKLGSELGGHKSFASAKDELGDYPCDPTRTWKVYDGKTKEYKAAPPDMQVCRAEPVTKGKGNGKKRNQPPGTDLPEEQVLQSEGTPTPPAPIAPGLSATENAENTPPNASPRKPLRCLDDVPVGFKSGNSPSPVLSPAISPVLSPSPGPLVPDISDRVSPEKSLRTKAAEAAQTSQVSAAKAPPSNVATVFEARLVKLVSDTSGQNQKQKKLDLVKERLISGTFPLGSLSPDVAMSITDRIRSDFLAKSEIAGPSTVAPSPVHKGIGIPSPKRPRIQAGQPPTPPECDPLPPLTQSARTWN